MAIDSLEAIPADGITQWIRVRGTGASNPVLVLIQQGPGLPMINEARRFRHLLKLEQAFTVIYWDQHGGGRSLRTPKDRADISLQQMMATRCRSSTRVAALVIMVVATVTARLVGLRLRAANSPLPPSPGRPPPTRRARQTIGP